MCMISIAGAARAGALVDPEIRELRALTSSLWETVARISKGRGPDEEDLAVLSYAQTSLIGQAQLLEYVRSQAAGDLPYSAPNGSGTLVELIWIAAEQLDVSDFKRDDGSEGVHSLARTLEQMSHGDRELAGRYYELWKRVAMLAARAAV